ncbi:MAG: RNA polymerase sigma factor [Bacteroidota bacterium]
MRLRSKKRALNQVLFSYTRMQEAVAAGRNRELRQLYQPCFEELMVFCLGKCKNKEMAQDAAAETLRVFLEHPNPKSIENLRAWLLRVAHNITIGMLDKHIRRRNILDSLTPTFSTTEEAGVQERIDAELLFEVIESALKEQDFQIWKLEKEGYKDPEIAKKLNMHPKTVANRKSMIKKTIREKLGKYNR